MMRSHYWIALAVVTTSLILGYSVFSYSVLPKLWQMHMKAESLQLQVLSLYEEIAKITEEIKLLNDSSPKAKAYIERIAREELGMIGPGEVLLKIDNHRIQEGRTDTHEKNIHP